MKMYHYERVMTYDSVASNSINLKAFFTDVRKTYDFSLKGIGNYSLSLYEKEYVKDFSRDYNIPESFLTYLEDTVPTFDFHHFPEAFVKNQTFLETFVNQFYSSVIHLIHDNPSYKLEEIISTAFDIITSHLRVLYHMYNHYANMEQLYTITPNLVDALMVTDFPTDIEMVKSPFNEIFIMLPINHFTVDTEPNISKHVEGFYLNLQDSPDQSKYLRIMVCFKPTKKLKEQHPINHAPLFWELKLLPNMNITDSINTALEDTTMESKTVRDIDSVEVFKFMKAITNLSINTLLYIASANCSAVLRNVPKRDINKNRIRKFIERESINTSYTELGSSDKIYIRPHTSNTSDSNGEGKPLDHLILVRGHFHGFWRKHGIASFKPYQIKDWKEDEYGQPMALVLKWVEPYYRGQGELITKEHVLTTGKLEEEDNENI